MSDADQFRYKEYTGNNSHPDQASELELDSFIRLYENGFPNPDERENPEAWKSRITEKPRPPEPRTHLILAIDPDKGKVMGGIIFEYYPASRCGLITYLIVDMEYRGRKVAKGLLGEATSRLKAEAEWRSPINRLLEKLSLRSGPQRDTGTHSLQAIFAESENPRELASLDSSMPAKDRLRAFHQLGAKWIRIPYVQPALSRNQERVRHLLLLCFPVDEHDTPDPDKQIITDFLRDFYRGLGVRDPDKDGDFLGMTDGLTIPGYIQPLYTKPPGDSVPEGKFVPEKPVPEDSVLSLVKCSVCLHFLEQNLDSNGLEADREYHYCPDFGSMEMDLLSHAFRNPPVCNSECITLNSRRVTLHFPATYLFNSEGRTVIQESQRIRVSAMLNISRTCFRHSGRTIWHMAFVPAENDHFTEHDIIKLIHLYDGKSERTNLDSAIRFSLDEQQQSGSVYWLLEQFIGKRQTVLKSGTIQIISDSGDSTRDPLDTHTGLMDLAKQGRQKEGKEEHEKLQKIIREGINEHQERKRVLLALCGIVTGIFDFDEIDVEEALDTLDPTFSDASTFIRIHRNTVVSISNGDRALEACQKHIGATPYLLLPHAVLIHNESLVHDAEVLADQALKSLVTPKPEWWHRVGNEPSGNLEELERNLHFAEKNMSQYLPDIFNYVTEKDLLEKGSQGRGLYEKRAMVQSKLKELGSDINSLWHIRREKGQMIVGFLLMLISVLQVKGSFEDDMGNLSSVEEITLFIAVGIVLGSLLIWSWSRGIRKKKIFRGPS